MDAAEPIVFFSLPSAGCGYAGVTMQCSIIAKDVFPTDLRGPAFAGVRCAAMIGMAGGDISAASSTIFRTCLSPPGE